MVATEYHKKVPDTTRNETSTKSGKGNSPLDYASVVKDSKIREALVRVLRYGTQKRIIGLKQQLYVISEARRPRGCSGTILSMRYFFC